MYNNKKTFRFSMLLFFKRSFLAFGIICFMLTSCSEREDVVNDLIIDDPYGFNDSIAFNVSLATLVIAEDFSVSDEEKIPTGISFNNNGTKVFVIGVDGDAVVEYALPALFDVTSATYSGTSEEFYVGGQETSPRDLSFNNDGTKMFVIGIDGAAVVEYTLSTPFDVSTAIYSGETEEYSVVDQESFPQSLSFNSDGTKMFVIGSEGDAVVEYELSDTFDVSSVTSVDVIEGFSFRGMSFNTDGTKMFVISDDDNAVVEYTLSIPFDVSRATLNEELYIGDQETSPQDITFNSDGTKMFVIGITGDAVVEYELPDTFDISTAIHIATSEEFSVAAQEGVPEGMSFNSDGTKMFVIGSEGDAVLEYVLPIPFDVSTAKSDLVVEFSVAAQDSVPTAMSFNNDGTKMFVIGSEGDAVLEYVLSTPFDVSTADSLVVEEFPVVSQENEPTGMSFNADGTKMFVIGSERNTVVEYDLSTAFDVSTATHAGTLEEFSVANNVSEPTGMRFNNEGTKMFVLDDARGAIVEYLLLTAFDVSTAIYTGAVEELSVFSQENSPRSITFNNDGSKMFVIGSERDVVIEYEIK